MPKDALADTIVDLDRLLTAVDSHESLQVPYLRQLRDELAATLGTIKALHDEQISLAARRQEVTQQLRITRGKGQDLAVKLRSALKAHFGHRFEGLVQFRIRPVRRRSRAQSEEVGIARLPSPVPVAKTGAAPAKISAAADSSSVSPKDPGNTPEKS